VPENDDANLHQLFRSQNELDQMTIGFINTVWYVLILRLGLLSEIGRLLGSMLKCVATGDPGIYEKELQDTEGFCIAVE
jgi:hypothetical protein